MRKKSYSKGTEVFNVALDTLKSPKVFSKSQVEKFFEEVEMREKTAWITKKNLTLILNDIKRSR